MFLSITKPVRLYIWFGVKQCTINPTLYIFKTIYLRTLTYYSDPCDSSVGCRTVCPDRKPCSWRHAWRPSITLPCWSTTIGLWRFLASAKWTATPIPTESPASWEPESPAGSHTRRVCWAFACRFRRARPCRALSVPFRWRSLLVCLQSAK